jgi:hypothetical protein
MNVKTIQIFKTEIVTKKEIIKDNEIIIEKEAIIEKEIITEKGMHRKIIKNINKPIEILKNIMIAILKENNKRPKGMSKDKSEDLLEDKKDNSIKNN